jgi:SRSO17 transposase
MSTELDRWAADFEAFHARFSRFFARREPRDEMRQYLRGLLSPVRRKNMWQMAEALGEAHPQRLQCLLATARWDADAVCAELARFVVEEFGHPEAIAVLDETSFVKKGTRSTGVKRQWCGALGKKENCQVAVFLAYVSPHGRTFLDRRLYLPKEWAEDAERRAAAKVPEEVEFHTKPELAQEMLAAAWKAQVPLLWITGDEQYGNSTALRDQLTAAQQRYVLAVASTTCGWATPPAVDAPATPPGGRPRTRPRLAPGAPALQTVAQLASAWPAEQWQRLTLAAGEKGPRVYDWGSARIVMSREGLPGEPLWLVVRRSLAAIPEYAYYLSNAPAETPVAVLARVAGARWGIEECFEEAKGETGLDEYEVRHWQSWHRHITLSMLAHAWLASVRNAERAAEAELGPPPASWSESTAALAPDAWRRDAEKKAGARVGGAQHRRGLPSPGGCASAAGWFAGATPRLVDMATEQATTGSA